MAWSAFFYFEGKIDQVAIFDYSLSASQVTELYRSSSTGVGNPMAITNGRKPVAYYPLGDYSAYNGTEYLVANSALSDFVFNVPASSNIITANPFSSIVTGSNKIGICTISYWLSTGTGQQDIIALTDSITHTAGFRVDSSNRPQYLNSQGGRYYRFNAVTDKLDNKFHHWAWVFSSDSVYNTLKLYIDGEEITFSFDYSAAPANVAWNGFYINKYQNASNANFKISNLSVISSALPATGTESVASLYNYGTPPDISSYSGLQGFWKLDAGSTFDGSNWTVPDESSNSNNGTSSGMTAANLVQASPPLLVNEPYSRYALDFDGTDDYIDLGNLQPSTTSLSISAWAYKTDTSNASIIGRGASVDYGVFIYSGSLMFGLNSGSWSIIAISNFTSNYLNQWFHVCATWDGSTMKLYLNGNEEASASKTGTITYTSNDTTIGKNSTLSGFEWGGSLSNISIWNAALTSAQVTEIYNEGKPSNLNNHSAYSNLVSWGQLGENSSFNSNWTVIDEKGTNNGTSANMAEDDLVNGVGTTANGLSSGMGGADNINGDAPYSTSNALSYGMGADAKSTSVPT